MVDFSLATPRLPLKYWAGNATVVACKLTAPNMTEPTVDLTNRRCRACEGGIPKLSDTEQSTLLAQLHGDWQCDGQQISRLLHFRNYYQTTAFVNAVIWVAHAEDHHPDIEFGFGKCTITYTTHAVKGLTENDFICAAKIDALLPELGDQ